MSMMNSAVRKSYRKDKGSSEAEGAKYARSIAKNASKVAAYKAGYELGTSGMSFSDARWQYEKTLTLSMNAKENEAFLSGHWAGEHGEESEF